MYKFKVSKYKNAAPRIPKKEQCITEIPCGQIMASFGNFLQVSGKHIAFNVESGAGGCAGVLPLDAVGRMNRKVPTIYAHSDFLSDMCFSPFNDDLLATCSNDGTLKLWTIPDNFEDVLDTPISKMRLDEDMVRRIDVIRFHPTANEVLACVSHDVLHVIDINAGVTKCTVELDKEIQFMSMDWKLDGTLLITSCKDTNNRLLDPRTNAVCTTFPGFGGTKESRVLWLGDLNYIFGAGFSKQRDRVITLWDIRNTSSSVSEEELDQGSGTLLPFHDIDTNLIMIGGKGDPFLKLVEFKESSAELSFSSNQPLAQQSFGMGMAPKRVLDVMNGEVNRMFQLSKNMIMPLPYIIPRKSYRDFQLDLFPDTVYSGKPSMSAAQWFDGENKEVVTLSLDPKLQTSKSIGAGIKAKVDASSIKPSDIPSKTNAMEETDTSRIVAVEKKSEDEINPKVTTAEEHIDNSPVNLPPAKKATKLSDVFSNTSKFKHLKGEAWHKKHNIENLKNLSESLPSESDGIQANDDFVAVSLSGAGGQISVFQISKPGRLPEFDIPVLVNRCNVLDFAMDPFDSRNIAVACEDWHIRLWQIPVDGLTTTSEEPKQILKGHENRVSLVKYHPTASNILVSASFDHTVRVWDLTDFSEIGALEGHKDQVLCLAWHPDGKRLVTVCRDKTIRLYKPVEDLEPISEGVGPDVVRGARVCWCGPGNNWLLISSVYGSGKGLFLYDTEDFKLLASIDDIFEDSPSVLSLHYDESSCVMFAFGKGERAIYAFEVNDKDPYLHQLSHAKFTDLHQGVRFLQKNVVDVRRIEFARAIRMTKTYMEIVSFTIPRVKMEFFQDDIFPDVRLSWEPALSAEEWLDGSDAAQVWISLKPHDMTKLSDAPQEAPKANKYCSQDILCEKTPDEKKKELIDAMMKKLDVDDKLEQDNYEGVDEDEWDE